MSELSSRPAAERRFVTTFPAAYNAVHGTQFSGEPERAGECEEGWDYRWVDPANRKSCLEVQHTAGAASAPTERVHPKNAMEIGSIVRHHMKSAGHAGFFVALRGNDSPRAEKFRLTLTAQICAEIDARIARGIPVGRAVTFGGRWEYGGQESRYGVELRRLAPPAKTFVMGSLGSIYENTTWRLTEAVRLKSAHIGHAPTEVILLVDFDLNGYDLEDIGELREILSDMAIPFREVWVADLSENTKIHRVWSRVAQVAGR